jgi:hypothetical protein
MAGKQGSTMEATNVIRVPENLKEAAETTLAQAKQAVDQCLHQVTDLHEQVGCFTQAAQADARDLSQNVLAAAEANINATFDFAQQFVRAADAQEIVALKQKFLRQRLERINGQMPEIGGTVKRPADEIRAGARPQD